ncbi:TPA: DNA methyltransferase [Vibrio harveyi]
MFKSLSLNESLPESIVNIDEKERSNLFTWRGQFSPQLVESLITNYGRSDSVVYDPFLGSGTILHEASLQGLSAFGCEINPAALAFAKVYELSTDDVELNRQALIYIEKLMAEFLDGSAELGQLHQTLLSQLQKADSKQVIVILSALITALDFEVKKLTLKRLQATWENLCQTVDELKQSECPIRAFHADARKSPLPQDSVDLVVTSPPYINVFNYHQNYRKSVESMGVDVLKVAKSEIGANRKFRQNRFLTVVQYCMDMAQVFLDLHRVSRSNGKVIFIVGRESNVRHTAFQNAELIRHVASFCGFKLEGEQHRVFNNKFGVDIYEEILRFSVSKLPDTDAIESAREVGRTALSNALKYADENVHEEIKSALTKSLQIQPSPLLEA